MGMRYFTDEEREILRRNPYTYKVTNWQIFFKIGFKEEFVKRYQSGMTPREVLYSLGYDPDIFGEHRLADIRKNILKQAKRGTGFTEGPRGKASDYMLKPIMDAPSDTVSKEAFIDMQHEILYLKQEIEFLKKISSLRDTKS